MSEADEIFPTDPYRPPQFSRQGPARLRVPLWYRVKRWIIAGIGLGAIAFAGLLFVQTLRRFGFAGGWHLLLISVAAFLLGAFAVYTAVRGRWRDIREFSLLP